MSDWPRILAAVVGIVSALAAIEIGVLALRTAVDFVGARRVSRVRFDKAVSETDIFGSLKRRFQTVGALSLEEYASSASARASLDAFLASAKSFLGTAPEPTEVEEDLAAQGRTLADATRWAQLTPQEAPEDVWNMLARTRMQLEMRLREVARQKGMLASERESVSSLLKRLTEAHVLPHAAYRDLLLFYRVASTAIHGTRVAPDLGNRALTAYESGINALERELATLQDVFNAPAHE